MAEDGPSASWFFRRAMGVENDKFPEIQPIVLKNLAQAKIQLFAVGS
jgi:hypothetical protein